MFYRSAILICFACVILSSAAHADELTADKIERLNNEAIEKFGNGDIWGALLLCRAATQQANGNPGWKLAANHGNFAAHLKLYAEAADRFRYAGQAIAPSDESYDVYSGKIAKRLKQALAEVGSLSVTVTPEGAEVLLDGASLGSAPLPDTVFVMPGAHEIQIRLEGYEPQQERIEVVRQGNYSITIDLNNLPSAAPTPSAATATTKGQEEESTDMSSTQISGLAMVGLGTMSGIASIILGVSSGSSADQVTQLRDDLRRDNDPSSVCFVTSPQCSSLNSSAETAVSLRGWAIGTGVAGGVLLASGILALTLGGESESSTPTTEITLLPLPGGISVRGTF